jgi:hypothetical protein
LQAFNTKKEFFVAATKLVFTISTNCQPTFPLVPEDMGEPAFPFANYRAKFNRVDLFNRLYYTLPFPHCHKGRKNHFLCFF